MRQAVELVWIVNLVLFAAIAVVCVRQWSSGRAPTALWAALAFVNLAAVMVVGQLLPDEPQGVAENALERVGLAFLVLFPYLLYRFAVAFEATKRPLAPYIDVLTSGLVVATFVLPHVPATGDSWPWWFAAYVIVFVIGRQQVRCNQAGGLQNLFGVAVVDFQDRRAALRLHANALETELLGAAAFVNALRVVI